MKYLLQKGLLHGDCLTVTGKTVAENLAGVPDLDFETQKIIYPLEHPLKATGHLQILYGNLAEKGSVAKITGKEGEKFEGLQEYLMVNRIDRRNQSRKSKSRRCSGDTKCRTKRCTRNAGNAETNFCNHWCRTWENQLH